MNDDWSLEGKSKGMQTSLVIGDIVSQRFIPVYTKEDIKTLQEKMIKDMEDAWCKICAKDDKMKYFFINAWRDSINKRFGVI